MEPTRFSPSTWAGTRASRAFTTAAPAPHTFRTLDTTPADLDRLLARHPGALVVIEACANAGWVHDRAVAAGHAGEGRQHRRRGVEVHSTSSARPTATTPCGWPSWRPSASSRRSCLPDPATRQRRMLIAFRQELVGRRVACQNRIRALFAGQGLPTPRGPPGVDRGRAGRHRARRPRPLAECGPDELWRGMLRPGGGRVPGPGGADRRGRAAARRAGRGGRGDAAAGDDPGRRAAHGRGGGRPPGRRARGSPRPSRSGRTPGWCRGSTRAG